MARAMFLPSRGRWPGMARAMFLPSRGRWPGMAIDMFLIPKAWVETKRNGLLKNTRKIQGFYYVILSFQLVFL